MSLLVFYPIWFLSYIIIFFLYKIVFIIFYKYSDRVLPEFKDYNSILKFLFILFYNKRFDFYDKKLNDKDIVFIERERFYNWPILVLIHKIYFKRKKTLKLKIRKMYKFLYKKQTKGVTFKEKYKTYNFFFENKLLNGFNVDKKVEYTLLNKFLSLKFNFFLEKKIKKNDRILLLLLYRKSIFDGPIKLIRFDERGANMINYLDILDNGKLFNKSQLVIDGSKKEFNLKKKHYMGTIYFKNYNISNNYIYYNNFLNKLNIDFNLDFIKDLNNIYPVSFSATNISKYLINLTNNKFNILYLRKNKIFNKSRYSRNRQTYRTGVYWCIYINVIAIIAFYFWFYKFLINFGYLWWLLFLFISAFFIPRSLKYRFYNIYNLLIELGLGLKWFSCIIYNFIIYLYSIKYLEYIYFNIIVYLYHYNIINKNKLINSFSFLHLHSIYYCILWLNDSILWLKNKDNLYLVLYIILC